MSFSGRSSERVFTKSPRDHRAYLIGDPKQAIYGFRGADVRTYLAARSTLVEPGQTPIELRHNFRSTAAMIEACNLIFDQQDDEPFFDSAEINYRTPALRAGVMNSRRSNARRYALGPGPRPGDPAEGGEAHDRRAAPGPCAGGRAGGARPDAGAGALRFGEPGQEEPVKPQDIYVLTATNPDALRMVAALSRGRGSVRVLQAGWTLPDERSPGGSRPPRGDRRPGRPAAPRPGLDHAVLLGPAGGPARAGRASVQ